MYDKVIFVCTENTCRSMMADTLYKAKAGERALPSASRGLVVLFPEPPNPKAMIALSNQGMVVENHVSTQLSKEELTSDTLVLTMNFSEKVKVIEDYQFEENVYTMAEFAGEGDDLVSPHGGSQEDYDECLDTCAKLVDGVINKLLVQCEAD